MWHAVDDHERRLVRPGSTLFDPVDRPGGEIIPPVFCVIGHERRDRLVFLCGDKRRQASCEPTRPTYNQRWLAHPETMREYARSELWSVATLNVAVLPLQMAPRGHRSVCGESTDRERPFAEWIA